MKSRIKKSDSAGNNNNNDDGDDDPGTRNLIQLAAQLKSLKNEIGLA